MSSFISTFLDRRNKSSEFPVFVLPTSPKNSPSFWTTSQRAPWSAFCGLPSLAPEHPTPSPNSLFYPTDAVATCVRPIGPPPPAGQDNLNFGGAPASGAVPGGGGGLGDHRSHSGISAWSGLRLPSAVVDSDPGMEGASSSIMWGAPPGAARSMGTDIFPTGGVRSSSSSSTTVGGAKKLTESEDVVGRSDYSGMYDQLPQASAGAADRPLPCDQVQRSLSFFRAGPPFPGIGTLTG